MQAGVVTITVGMLVVSVVQTWYDPEHIFQVWIRTEIFLFALWIAWVYDPYQHTVATGCSWIELCFLSSEKKVVGSFLGVFFFTILMHIVDNVVVQWMPYACCADRLASCWWRVRTELLSGTNG